MSTNAAYRQRKRRKIQEEIQREQEQQLPPVIPDISSSFNDESTLSDLSISLEHDDGFHDNDNWNNSRSELVIEELSILSQSFEEVMRLSGSDNNNTTEENIKPVPFREKLTQWVLRNLQTLLLDVVSQLLKILIEEGYSLPRTCETLIGTQHKRQLHLMLSSRETNGEFAYLGIRKGLQRMIDPSVYTENEIAVLFHIDGMQIYRSSRSTVWPIVMKLQNNNYSSRPIVVAIYCGDSKPASVEEYLEDFVMEVNDLTENGVKLGDKVYAFKNLGITADSPARAYIKNIKAPGAFYACERCTTHGVSVGEYRHKTRVYPEMACEKRTKETFHHRDQPEHHHAAKTPLVDLVDFDPVNMVILDSMHLLYSGAMQWLLDKWMVSSCPQRLKKRDIKKIQACMNSLKTDIPQEFQRKRFDMSAISNWKATQFRFFLHYCGPLVLQDILSQNHYAHFLLLYSACRILNNDKLSKSHLEQAKQCLRPFFFLLPSLYGEKSQVLSMHNLIHVADDVEHFQTPLSEISAFWGENYIAVFKKLVKSPLKPLTQIVNRLEELEGSDRVKIQRRKSIENVDETSAVIVYHQKEFTVVARVEISSIVLKPIHPNNIVQLKSGIFFTIQRILLKTGCSKQLHNLYIVGFEALEQQPVFVNPMNSVKLGIVEIIKFSKKEALIPAVDISYKSILFHLGDRQYAISYLHAHSSNEF